MTRALVTGATGFLGLHLARRLTEDGWQVIAPVRAGSPTTRVSELRAIGCLTPLLESNTLDIVRAIVDAQPDAILHLATLFRSDHAASDIEPLIQANVLFGTQVLEGLRELGGGVFVNVGSYWQQFGDKPYSPVSLYGATKQAFADVVAYYQEACRVRTQSLTLCDCYGPGDPRRKLLSVLLEASRTGVPVDLSPGEQLIDLVHADDAVAAFVAALARARAPGAAGAEQWAVRSGHPITIRELVAVFERAREVTVPVRWGARPYRAREMFVAWTRGELVPGWAPRVTLEEGLRTLV